MSDETARLKLAQLVSLQELNAVTWNEALAELDVLVDLYLLGQFVNTPPPTPQDGDAYLTGGAPTGAWSGYTYKIAACLDGAWRFYAPFNGLRAFVASSGAFVIYLNGVWSDTNSLISASETSIASAATCDLGAAGSLFVQITGTTTITAFGTGANKLRFVRFAQGLTLTHNATSLILLGGASRATAAGDLGIYTSDAGGNWRERSYFRAAANPSDYATKSASETLTNKTLGAAGFPGGLVDASGNFAIGTTTVNGQVNIASALPGIGNAAILNIAASANSLDLNLANLFAPNIGAANHCWFNWGVSASTRNAASLGFYYAGAGSMANRFDFALWGSPVALAMTAAGWVGLCGVTAPNAPLDVGGHIYPHADNTYNLGSASYRFGTVYAGTGTINTSGAATKTNLRALTEAEAAVAGTLAANIRVFQFCDAVRKKGDAARLHVGMIFEDVVAAFAAQGLDPERYGIVCRDRDETDAAKWIVGLRYDELAQFVIAGLAARLAAVEARR